jgi:hypothetical protein
MFQHQGRDYNVNDDGSYALLQPNKAPKLFANRNSLLKAIEKENKKQQQGKVDAPEKQQPEEPKAKKGRKKNDAVVPEKSPEKSHDEHGLKLLTEYLKNKQQPKEDKHDFIVCDCDDCKLKKEKKVEQCEKKIEREKELITLIQYVMERNADQTNVVSLELENLKK